MVARALASGTTWARGAATFASGFAVADLWRFHALGTTADLTVLGAALGALGLHVAFQAGVTAAAPKA